MSCYEPRPSANFLWWYLLVFVIMFIILIICRIMASIYIERYRANKRLIIPTEETLVETNVNEAYEMPVN